MSLSEQQNNQLIIIDPERLMKLKKQRKAFKMVPSIYEPPQQSQCIAQQINQAKTQSSNKNKSSGVDKGFTPYEKVIELRQLLNQNNIQKSIVHPNVQYIWSLLPQQYKREIYSFQQGDCIPQDGVDRWLVLEGQIKVIGINNHWYSMGDGYMFFSSRQTAKKVKQVVAVKSTKLLKIKDQVFKDYLKTYLFLKNSQKIKFLKYCPFFIWKNQLTQDLVLCMNLKIVDRDQTIYLADSKSEAIYFVKEGIVLLERNTAVQNPIIKDYEMHYQKNQVNQNDAILVVRKGMAFGIDGIILKEVLNQSQDNLNKNQEDVNKKDNNDDEFNPQNQFLKREMFRKSTRVYNAKTIGNTQIYQLKKQILQTLFNLSDVNDINTVIRRQISSQQLERMSIQYTNMIVNHTKRLPLISLKKKDFILTIKQPKNQEEKQKEKQKFKKQFSHKNILLQKNAYKQKRKTVDEDKFMQQFALKEAPMQRNQMRGKSFTKNLKKSASKANSKQAGQRLYIKSDRKISLPTIKMDKILNSQKAKQIFESKLIKKQSRKRLKRLLQKSQSLQKIQQVRNEVSLSYDKSTQKHQNPSAFISIKSYKSIINLH